MGRGRRPARKMARGGSCGGSGQMPCGGAMRRGGRSAPRGRGRKMAHGGTSHCGHPGQPSCESIGYSSEMGGYRGGGRTRPSPRGGGRQMARGGRAPARKFQGGGGVECPAGSFKTADGRCTQMGS